MKKYLIFYHFEDNDGVLSASIIYDYLIRNNLAKSDSIELRGVNYNMLDKLSKSDEMNHLGENYQYCYMTDISFDDFKDMLRLVGQFGAYFTWIDHHKPIIEASKAHGFSDVRGLRDTRHSAIYNAFRYLYPDKEVPELYKLLSAYDSWSFKEEEYGFEQVCNINKAFTFEYNLDTNACIRVVRDVMENGNYTTSKIVPHLYTVGALLNEYEDRRYESILKYGDIDWKVNGRKAAAMFVQGQTSSRVFKSCPHGVLNGIVFKRNPDSTWTISLYNTGSDDHSFNCGEYMKEYYHGGGHEGAAGCTITQEQFIRLLDSKSL